MLMCSLVPVVQIYDDVVESMVFQLYLGSLSIHTVIAIGAGFVMLHENLGSYLLKWHVIVSGKCSMLYD